MCIEDGCQRHIYVESRGLCRKHWRDRRSAGTLGPLLNKSGRPAGGQCTADECERTDLQGDGLCRLHYKRAYRAANRERLNEQARAADPERRREALRKHAEAHPLAGVAGQQRHRAKRAGVEVLEVSEEDLRRIYSSPCLYCGAVGGITADHVVPISRGGRHSVGNLVPACQTCNKRKAGRLLIEWRSLP